MQVFHYTGHAHERVGPQGLNVTFFNFIIIIYIYR